MPAEGRPVLWHIPISHYNEKARWALAWKGIEHERRAPPPGVHIPVALWLTRGSSHTFPVLQIDGTTIGDSTAIIAELERRNPEPPLYPAVPEDRRRALEIEDYFDEEVGPQIRRLAFHEWRRDREYMKRLGASMLPGPVGRFGPARSLAGAFGSTYVELRFRVSGEETAERARAAVGAAVDRLEAELARGGGEYLVGDAFSVADLTAASCLYPLAAPPEGPWTPGLPESLDRFVTPLRERSGCRWVREMFVRHRKADARARQ